MSREGTAALLLFSASLLSMTLFGIMPVLGTLAIVLGAATLGQTIINDA